MFYKCVIGADVAGLCAARACLERGLNITIFDSRSQLGDIWDETEPIPVFETLTTNTASFETAFSDVSLMRVNTSRILTEHDNLCLTHTELHE